MNQRQWRLICDEPAIGRWNMAVDEAILDAVGAGDQPPTLRLYAWQPACLSLGIGQSASDSVEAEIHARGWDIVRRPTGGRAILHIDELTYSLALPPHHSLTMLSIVDSYRQISRALMHALQILGAAPVSQRRDSEAAKRPGPVCFETPSHYEITVGGRKLVGSAQMRRKSGLLQHGTLPLFGDVARICEVLAYDSQDELEEGKASVRNRATTLLDVLGRDVTWAEAASAVTTGFCTIFDVDIAEGTLSEAEIEHARILEHEKYGAAQHIFAR